MKIRYFIVAIIVFLMVPLVTVLAYTDDPEVTTAPSASDVETISAPFSPSGTGTVIDNATDADGKEFYTVVTADENVFYLVIDKQRGSENVYFLNGVTEADLIALAEKNDTPITSSIEPKIEQPQTTTPPEPSPSSEQIPAKSNSGLMIALISIFILGAGGAIYYFKIYRPKKLGDTMDEYDEYETDNTEDNASDDTPPWDEDDTEAEEPVDERDNL